MTLCAPNLTQTAFHPALPKRAVKSVIFGMSQNTYSCFTDGQIREERGYFAELGQRLKRFLGLPEPIEATPYQYIHTNFTLQPGWVETDQVARNDYSLNFWG